MCACAAREDYNRLCELEAFELASKAPADNASGTLPMLQHQAHHLAITERSLERYLARQSSTRDMRPHRFMHFSVASSRFRCGAELSLADGTAKKSCAGKRFSPDCASPTAANHSSKGVLEPGTGTDRWSPVSRQSCTDLHVLSMILASKFIVARSASSVYCTMSFLRCSTRTLLFPLA